MNHGLLTERCTMGNHRLNRVNELVKREIAGALYRVINEPEFDHAAVTVIRVETARDLRRARVYLSIWGDADSRHRMLRLMRKHRIDIQREIGSNLVLKYTPQLRFEFDPSVQEGDRILHMISELDEFLDPDEDPEMPHMNT